jgi:hypothetical protein
VTRLWDRDPEFHSAVGKRFFSSPQCPDQLWEAGWVPFDGCHRLPPGVQWPGHETDHSPPPSATVKDERSYYFYSSCVSSWHAQKQTFTIGLTYTCITPYAPSTSIFHQSPSIHTLSFITSHSNWASRISFHFCPRQLKHPIAAISNYTAKHYTTPYQNKLQWKRLSCYNYSHLMLVCDSITEKPHFFKNI